MDRKISGADRLDLYVRALDQMAQNPHIPQLFRDVFKGAFLPYRDSETLNLFLKEMNGFTYAAPRATSLTSSWTAWTPT